jgi:hypothetical protein
MGTPRVVRLTSSATSTPATVPQVTWWVASVRIGATRGLHDIMAKLDGPDFG